MESKLAIEKTLTVSGKRKVSEWNRLHRQTSYFLVDHPCQIAKAMPDRLVKYAIERLTSIGFGEYIKLCNINIDVMDANCLPSDRHYTVSFNNRKGGQLSINGIFTKSGWPFLDHGISIEEVDERVDQ